MKIYIAIVVTSSLTAFFAHLVWEHGEAVKKAFHDKHGERLMEFSRKHSIQ